MVKKVKRAKYRRGTKSKNKLYTNKYQTQQTGEKIFLLAAICLAIISIILLFNPNATTFVTLDSSLSKTNYDAGEALSGQLELVMQENDILGKDATLVSLDVFNKIGEPKCPEVYICYNKDTIEWQYYNTTRKKCMDIEYDSGNTGDPAAECCYRNQANCLGIVDAIDNEGFELNLAGTWIANPVGRADREHKANTPTMPNGGDYSGKTDAEGVTDLTEKIVKLSQTIPDIPVKYFGTYMAHGITGRVVQDFVDSLNFSVRWEEPEQEIGMSKQTYYFEVVLQGKPNEASTTKYYLHYWFNLGKMPPADSATNKYIVLATKSNFPEKTWKSFQRNVYEDWRTKGFSATDILEKIELRSVGIKTVKQTTPEIPTGRVTQQITLYGQKANWDNIFLKYNLEASTKCEDYGKKCCLEERGVGNYYGEQLTCSVGKCWDACTESELFTFEEFISYSTTPDKGNWTSGEYRSGIRLLGGTGEGYGYCFETTDTDNDECYGWDNSYKVKLGNDSDKNEFEFSAPEYEGEYELSINVTFTNFQGTILKLDSSKETFFVGEGVADCPDSDYTWTEGNWSDWGDCINGTQKRTRTLTGAYSGTDVDCPETKTETETQEQACGCTPDWKCEWQYCISGEQQDKVCIDLNSCEESYVDDTRNCCIEDWKCSSWGSCEFGEQTRTCYDNSGCDTEFSKPEETKTCEKPFFMALWWLWLIILIVVVIVVLFATKVFPLPKMKKKEKAKTSTSIATATEYTELTNYINQALGYGATKQEIRQKLSDAGWPTSAIDKAFKTTGD